MWYIFKDIPIAILFKGLGITSDQEIVQMVGIEDFILEALTPCLYEAHSLQVFTQIQVLYARISIDFPTRSEINLGFFVEQKGAVVHW